MYFSGVILRKKGQELIEITESQPLATIKDMWSGVFNPQPTEPVVLSLRRPLNSSYLFSPH